MKKHKGSLIDFLPTLIVILASCLVIIVAFDIMKLMSLKQDIKAVARGYVLEMETIGYLTPESAAAFKQELTDLGVKEIDFSNTTMTPAGYGNPVYLHLNCVVYTETLNMSTGDILEFFFEKTIFPIEINMKSTAKY